MRNLQYQLLATLGPLYARTQEDALRILAYHTVPDPVAYERQLRYLKQHYHVISLDELQEAMTQRKALPPRSVLITFDDGDRSVYENGLPLHRKYELPAVLFVITDLVDSEEPFWWKKVEQHYAANGLPHADARRQVTHLKQVTDDERRAYLDSLGDAYRQKQLTREELKELGAAGFALSNHTLTHPLVDRCSDERITREVAGAADYLSELPNTYPRVFAYPNGNVNERTEKVLKQEGISLAFLFDHRLTRRPYNPLRMSRLRVNTYDPLPEFRSKVSGLHSVVYHRSFH